MRVVLVGGGGHASDVLAAFEAAYAEEPGGHPVIGVVDDDPGQGRVQGRGVRALGTIDQLGTTGASHYVLAVGWPTTRRTLLLRVEAAGLAPATVIDPGASVHRTATIGSGTVVLWGSHVSAMASIGAHAVISHGALIGHDCSVGDFASVMPGAAVSGDTELGEACTIGTNATIREGVAVGAGATLAAGAVAVRDIPAGVTAKGIPARW
jgi:sugar O-acyltransferase (sialic acid O-acetyltransferase NeuD family)